MEMPAKQAGVEVAISVVRVSEVRRMACVFKEFKEFKEFREIRANRNNRSNRSNRSNRK